MSGYGLPPRLPATPRACNPAPAPTPFPRAVEHAARTCGPAHFSFASCSSTSAPLIRTSCGRLATFAALAALTSRLSILGAPAILRATAAAVRASAPRLV